MAKNIFDKLNVLVRSGLSGLLGDDPDRSPRLRSAPSSPLGKQVDRDIAALRQQINRALDDEDRMQAEIAAMQQQIATWDQQADEAVARHDDDAARQQIRQIQLKQQHLAMLEADLTDHQYATSELIRRVNEMEAIVAEARQHQKEKSGDEPTADRDTSLVDRLQQVRQMAGRGLNLAGSGTTSKPVSEHAEEVDDQTIDDDLAQRRARLSQ
jgi:chromosome segregation ATPase